MKIKYIGRNTPNSKELYNFVEENFPEYLTEDNPDLILVAGGDGSMLHTIKDYSHLNVPFFGIGMGSLNFLMNDISDPKKLMETIINKKLDVINARSMSVKVLRNGEIVFNKYATNDIMLGNGIMNYHKFLLNSDDATFTDKLVFGQSLIVSTAIGSTAISFNNDMQIIPSFKLDIFAISSVLASKDTAFKKVVKSKQKISVKILSKRQTCKLFVDGTAHVIELEKNDEVVFTRGKKFNWLS